VLLQLAARPAAAIAAATDCTERRVALS
jgi:hypothetical protein